MLAGYPQAVGEDVLPYIIVPIERGPDIAVEFKLWFVDSQSTDNVVPLIVPLPALKDVVPETCTQCRVQVFAAWPFVIWNHVSPSAVS